MVGPVKNP